MAENSEQRCQTLCSDKDAEIRNGEITVHRVRKRKMKYPNKQKLLRILEILKKDSDEEHPLTAAKICDLLRDEYGITAERKSVRRDIELLSDMGLAEDVYPGGVSPEMRGAYYADRVFEDWQLKLLTDAVTRAVFIDDTDAREMTDKLIGMAGPSSRALLEDNLQEHTSVPSNRFRYVLDTLLVSIKEGRQVSFKYFDLNEDGKKVYRKNGRRYLVNPYNIYWIDRSYYLICNTDGKSGLSTYRLDRMDNAEKEEAKRLPVTNLPDGDLSEKAAGYPKENASHFLGSRIPVDIRCDKKWLGSVRDVFGYDNVTPLRSKKDTNRILTVHAEGLYISLMQLGSKIEVLSPESVRSTLTGKLEELLEVYRSKE